MSAASPRSFHHYNWSPAEDGMADAEKSWAKTLQDKGLPETIPGIDPDRFRAWFVPAFARWLRQQFRNPDQVAGAFGVNYRTAVNWWNGDNRACGDRIGFVFLTFPQAMAWFMADLARHDGRHDGGREGRK